MTGAYKFTIHCEKNQVIMDVENHLYARKDIKQLGIAPMTSMFSCGTNERRMYDTVHPQIHDSESSVHVAGQRRVDLPSAEQSAKIAVQCLHRQQPERVWFIATG
ncbi:glucan biosynthesis protein [Shigella sonnei]